MNVFSLIKYSALFDNTQGTINQGPILSKDDPGLTPDQVFSQSYNSWNIVSAYLKFCDSQNFKFVDTIFHES